MKRLFGRTMLVLVLLAHAGMVAWMAWSNSPNADEIAHLPAGIYIWQFGRFDVYCVNPPLVRLIAAAPVVLCGPKTDWGRYYNHVGMRAEFLLADDFITANGGEKTCGYFFLARLVLIPASLVGAYICFAWARELYGTASGYLALLFWSFSPNLLAWAACIDPDLVATVAGSAVMYAFWHWLHKSEWDRAVIVGILLGLALLTKLTWIVLTAILPVLWLVWAACDRPRRWRESCNGLSQLAVALGVGLFLLNAGYFFSGSLERLGDYSFMSKSLGGTEPSSDPWEGGNRFRGTFLENIRIPFPHDYVAGIDLQKCDFERGKDSYLLGQWSHHGWWYYYLVAAAVKIPLGIWGLFFLGVFAACRRGSLAVVSRHHPRRTWRDTIVLVLPGLFLFAFVSAQTGFSRHFRYVLPTLPFFFVWISSAGRWLQERRLVPSALVTLCTAWFLASSLAIFPHSMSYFNELAGGPGGGDRVLLDSNLDWGQDILYLKQWGERHPEARPLHVDCYGHHILPMMLRIGPTTSVDVNTNLATGLPTAPRLTPGWHALSIHRVHKTYPYLLDYPPAARIAESILVFHIRAAGRSRTTR